MQGWLDFRDLKSSVSSLAVISACVGASTLYHKLQAARLECTRVQAELDRVQAKLDRVQAKLDQSESGKGRIASEYEGVLRDYRDSQDTILRLRRELRDINLKMVENEKTSAARERTIQQLKKEASKLCDIKNQLHQRCTKLDRENAALKTTASDPMQELIAQHRLEQRELEDQNRQLEKEVSELRLSLVELHASHNELHASNTAMLEEKIGMYKERAERFQQQLTDFSEDLSDRLAYVDATVFFPQETPLRETNVERLKKQSVAVAQYYNSSHCFVTAATARDLDLSIGGDHFCNVIAAHLAPHANATKANAEGNQPGLETFHVNSERNFMFLRKDIEAGFDEFYLSFEYDQGTKTWLCVVLHPDVDDIIRSKIENELRGKVSAWDLRTIMEHIDRLEPKLSEMDGRPLNFPNDRSRFNRVLRAHFHTAVNRMQSLNWRPFDSEVFRRLVIVQQEMVSLCLSRAATPSLSLGNS